MGKLFDRFGNLNYSNEDEVKQNFVVPLFTDFLGYELDEIKPEKFFPARHVHSGVNKIGDTKGLTNRPDYVVCLNGEISQPKLVLDAKDISENIDDHLPQIKSYTLSVGINLIAITNGKQLKVFNSNDLLFVSNNIVELEERFEQLYFIISRDSLSTKSLKEIISGIDNKIALGLSEEEELDKQIQLRKIELNDFKKYLEETYNEFKSWQIPHNFQALDNLKLEGFNPIALHNFYLLNDEQDWDLRKNFTFSQIEYEFKSKIKIFIGDTGIGKTTLLKFLAYKNAEQCINFNQTKVPIYIPLRNISKTTPLENLIKFELQAKGYQCDSVLECFNKNKILLLLDAYDEVLDNERHDLDIYLRLISQKCDCYITSRRRKIPEIKPADIFLLDSLRDEKIDEIIRFYLEDSSYKFINEVDSKRLNEEVKNTFLLLLMISIYKDEGKLPFSIIQITEKVINRIIEWDRKNSNLNNGDSAWAINDIVLPQLAYKLIEKDSVVISKPELEELLLPIIKDIEANRVVKPGKSISNYIEAITITGIIIDNGANFTFWHRIFLNYFASQEIARKIKQGFDILSISEDVKWETPVSGCSNFLADSSNVINKINPNIWLASSCLIESKLVDEATKNIIIEQLIIRCESEIAEIRNRAMWYLKRIISDKNHDIFWEIYKNTKHKDIKAESLEEITNEKTIKAKELLLANLGWDEGRSFFNKNPITSVINGLVNFEEAEHLLIIDVWRKKGDIFTTKECKNALLKLYRQGRLSNSVKIKLYELYFETYKEKEVLNHKLGDIGSLLSLIKDESYMDRLKETLIEDDINHTLNYRTTIEIFANYDSSESIVYIMNNVKLESNEIKVRTYFAEIIRKSKAVIPLTQYLELLKLPEKPIQIQIIRALSRFTYLEIKNHIDKYINSTDAEIQNAAFQVADCNGIIWDIIRCNKFPKLLYWNSTHSFFDSIKKYKITWSKEIIGSIYDNVNKEEGYNFRFRCRVLEVYLAIDCIQEAKSIIQEFYKGDELIIYNQHDLYQLMEVVYGFEKEYSTKILIDIYRNALKLGNSRDYLYHKLMDAVEKVGGEVLINIIKEIVETQIKSVEDGSKEYLNIERMLRALTVIGSNNDEKWIISILSKKVEISWPDVKRGIECLGIFGGDDSIKEIVRVATKYRQNDLVVSTCLFAYESIIRRKGIQMEVTINDLFN